MHRSLRALAATVWLLFLMLAVAMSALGVTRMRLSAAEHRAETWKRVAIDATVRH